MLTSYFLLGCLWKKLGMSSTLHLLHRPHEGVYDSVNHSTLWTILQLLAIIHVLHENSTAAVRAYRQTSEEFTVICGVQLGCVLAPILFNLYFDVAIRMEDHQMQGRGVSMAYLHDAKLMGNRKKLQLETIITDLEYADDMALAYS